MTDERSAWVGLIAALLIAGGGGAYVLWLLATDTCLDRGGRVTGFSCETAEGQAVTLASLLPFWMPLALAVFVAVVFVRGLRAVARARTGSSSLIGS